MTDIADQPTISALRTLGYQFEAIESSEAAPRASARWRQVAVAMLCGLAVTAVGLSPPGRAVADKLGELIGIETPTPPPARETHPHTETHLELPSPQLVKTCEDRLRSAPTDEACLTVVLLARGDLAPGDYTNDEFDRALAEALTASGRLPR